MAIPSSMERGSTVHQNGVQAASRAVNDPDPGPSSGSSDQASEEEELPLQRAYYWERTRAESVFLTQPIGGKLRSWTWAEVMNEARRMASYLEAREWPPRSHVIILSRNSAWWIMAELAIWMSGHVTVPIYTSLPIESARQLFAHSEPVACFLGSLDSNELLPQAFAPGLTFICFPDSAPGAGIAWEAVVAEQSPMAGSPVRDADDLATIIYTSGTTGSPKGVMHRFGAFPYFVKAVTQVTGRAPGHRVLSYLPLAHIAERALTEITAMSAGWHIFFCENPATFLADLKRARPTFFFSVPRLYEKFRAGVLQKIPQRRLDWLQRIPLLNHFVRRRILDELGLGSVRTAASGSAPLAPDLLLWFRTLGLPLTEGYGTTEIGITHAAPAGEFRQGCVGRSTPGVLTQISSDGEVLVNSPMNMLGYYKDPQSTRAAFTETGFLRTGDLGELDADGWLKIKGRIKEQFKTTKGKYVMPSTVEFMLNADPCVEASLVMGSGLPAPFGVVVLSTDTQHAARTKSGRDSLEESLEGLLASTNSRLAPHEHLKFLVLVTSAWSSQAGLLTPTMKLKRHVLEAHYAPYIPDWTARNRTIIWHVERE